MENNRSLDWFKQAENDLAWAQDTLRCKRFSQVCFIAQQTGEKALKALALKRGFDQIRTHSIVELAKELGINGDILEAGKRLDQYYISSRYPDAFPAGAPFEFFTEAQGAEAIRFASSIIEYVRNSI